MNARISDLNDIYTAIASLREARALLSDRVRGTNDSLYEICKGYELAIANAERAYKNIRQNLP